MAGKYEKLAKRYAKALFTALQPASFDAVDQGLSSMAAAWKSNDELRAAFAHPLLSDAIRVDICKELLSVAAPNADTAFAKVIEILATKRKLDLLPDFSNAFSALLREYKKSISIRLVSAENLSDAEKQNILDQLKQKVGSQISVEWEVNPEIIGGLVFRVGDRMLDRSINRALEQIGAQLLA